MKRTFLALALASALTTVAEKRQTFTGVITDTMCGSKHAMNIRPDDKCVRECVKMDPKKWNYALLVAAEAFALSDQQTPERFAAQVKVTGTIFEKVKILKADRIETVR